MKIPHGAEKRAIALAFQGVDSLVGQSDAGLFERFEAGIEIYKGEIEAEGGREGFEDASSCGNDLTA